MITTIIIGVIVVIVVTTMLQMYQLHLEHKTRLAEIDAGIRHDNIHTDDK